MQLNRNTQRKYCEALDAIEDAARQLIRRVMREHVGSVDREVIRERLEAAYDKLQLFKDEAEDLICGDLAETPSREAHIDRFHRQSDELIKARAKLDRSLGRAQRQRRDEEFRQRMGDFSDIEGELKSILGKLD